MTEVPITLGEVGRRLSRIDATLEALTMEVRDRHHALSNQVIAHIGPVSVLKHQMDTAEEKLKELDAEMKAVTRSAAKVSGAAAMIAFIAGMIPWPWKAVP